MSEKVREYLTSYVRDIICIIKYLHTFNVMIATLFEDCEYRFCMVHVIDLSLGRLSYVDHGNISSHFKKHCCPDTVSP